MRAIFASGTFFRKSYYFIVQDLLHLSTTIDGKYKIAEYVKSGVNYDR